MKIYNIALIGCGDMGATHLEDIYFRDNIKIKYLCDLNTQRAEKFKEKYNGEFVTNNYNDCIEDENVDIVIAATYPSSHLDILSKCIKHKKHLLCEKPIASNLSDGKKFIKLMKDNPEVKVLVGYILRHNETYKKVQKMISEGAIGFPFLMRITHNHQSVDWEKHLNLIMETSPIIDCGVHYIDAMRWFTGAEPIKIEARGLRLEADVPSGKYNYGTTTIKFSDGSLGSYEVGWGKTISESNIKEFVGPKGRIKIIYSDSQQNVEGQNIIEYYKAEENKYERYYVDFNRKPTGEELLHLIRMIEIGEQPYPCIDDVWESFKIAIKVDKIICKNL